MTDRQVNKNLLSLLGGGCRIKSRRVSLLVREVRPKASSGRTRNSSLSLIASEGRLRARWNKDEYPVVVDLMSVAFAC